MTFSAKNLFSEKFRSQDLESQELFAGLDPFEPQKYCFGSTIYGEYNPSVNENQTGYFTDYSASRQDVWSITNVYPNEWWKFQINSSGNLSVSSPLNYEYVDSYNLTIRLRNDYGVYTTKNVVVSVLDVNEYNVTTPYDANSSSNSISEYSSYGATVGITALASDADGTTNTITYSDNSGLFSVHPTTGVVTLSGTLDYETAPSHSVTITATSADGSSADNTFTINVSDYDEHNVTTPTDGNNASNEIDENASAGTVGITASASDADGTTNTITYSLTSDDSGNFDIDSETGVVSTTGSLNHEEGATRTIEVTATSADGSSKSQTFNISVNDIDEFDVSSISDTNSSAETLAEDASSGAAVGITAAASDADGTTNTITYSLSSNPGSLFAINSSTGIVTLSGSLDYETATSHDIEVTATSADTSTSTQSYTIAVTDIDEHNVSAISDTNTGTNTLAEDASSGTAVGITASASDADSTTNTITYSLSSNPGNLFAIGSSSGIVTLSGSLDYETATSHDIEVTATSADTSTSTASYTIGVTDVDEHNVSAISDANLGANALAEDASSGAQVGITASASDADGSNDTITYSLTSNPGSLFAIDGSTGVVTLSGSLDYETATSHSIEVTATSADTSTSTASYTIGVTNVNEAPTISTGATGSVAENAATSTVIYDAAASDVDSGDSITFSVDGTDKDLVSIDGSSGVVTLKSSANYESKSSYSFDVIATDDGTLTDSQSVTVSVTNVNEAPSISTGTSGSVAENAATSTVVYDAAASDVDAGDSITFSVDGTDKDLVSIDGSSGVVTLKSSANYESKSSYSFDVIATDDGTLTDSQSVTVSVTNVNEAPSISTGASGSVAENAATSTVIYDAAASDEDTQNNSSGLTISHTVTVQNVGGKNVYVIDGNQQPTLSLENGNTYVFDVSAINSAHPFKFSTTADGTHGGGVEFTDGVSLDSGLLTILVTDTTPETLSYYCQFHNGMGGNLNVDLGETVTFSVDGADKDLVNIDGSTGEVTLVSSANFESAKTSYSFDVIATDRAGLTDTQSVNVSVTDVDEFDVSSISDTNSSAETLAENASSGAAVGITASASDSDGTTNTITYSLSSNPGSLFAIDSSTGIVTLSSTGSLDYETATSHDIEVTATSADTSTSTESYTIAVTDVDEHNVTTPTDGNNATNEIDENASAGTVGITASASDADGTTNTITYSLTSDDGGNFDIDSETGVVSTTGSLNHEEGATRTIEVTATSADGSSKSETFNISVNDIDEFDVSSISDTNSSAETLAEDASSGAAVGITAAASDADGTTNTITYSLSSNPGNLFAIGSSSGIVTLSGSLDYETATSHDIEVTATSADTSTSTQSYTIAVTDVDEYDVSAVSDDDSNGNTLAENASTGAAVGITAAASDSDGTTNTITYSLSSNPGSLFAIDSSTGIVTLSGSLDYETATSHTIEVTATSADASTSTASYDIAVTDVDEYDVSAVSDDDSNGNTLAENASTGAAVGITAAASDSDGTTNTITYSLSSNPGSLFAIDSSTGIVTLSGSLDYETATSHTIEVTATSADASTSTASYDIAVTDVDEYDVSAVSDDDSNGNTLAENASTGAAVGITAAASDSDGTTNTITYSLSSNPGSLFAIDSSTGIVTLSGSLDYETATSHTIEVTATSADASTSTASYDIAVTDVDEYDVSAVSDDDSNGNTLAENASTGAAVGITAAASDSDGTTNTITYSLSSNPGSLFAIDSSTGIVTLSGSLDYETATSHTIEVTATSADASTSTASYDIAVTDVDEYDVTTPTDGNNATNEIDENASAGTVGVTASASDSDGTTNTVTYSLTNNDSGNFDIDSETGVVSTTGSLDHEAGATRTIEVEATSADGSSKSETFTIAVNDINEAPVIESGASGSVAENAATSTVIYDASGSDVDAGDSITFSLDGADKDLVSIDGSSGEVTLNSSANFESAKTSYSFDVVATDDGGLTDTQSVTVSVTDVNDAPIVFSGATGTVLEGAATSTIIYDAHATDEDTTHPHSITYGISGADAHLLTIDADDGEVRLKASADYEAQSSYSFAVNATDGSLTTSQDVRVSVTDVDTDANDASTLKPGSYTNTLLGNGSFDTLSIQHNNADGTSQMYVGLDSGVAMYGDGVASPLLRFAETGKDVSYDMTWERLELVGDSNDVVVVGGGLELEANNASLDVGDHEIIEGFFELDLGRGNDRLYVNDTSSAVLVDLSKTSDQLVDIHDASGNEVHFDIDKVNPSAPGSDGASMLVTGVVGAHSNVVGSETPVDGVIDYIQFGDATQNKVDNDSVQGIAVDFGTSDGVNRDVFEGSSKTDSDLIDLRGTDGVIAITDSSQSASGSKITIDIGSNVDIDAHSVDLLYVSELDASDNAIASDSDVLVNAEARYGDTKGILGQASYDHNGDGYDVITSAKLVNWAGHGDKQIYYDGDHTDFTDSGDVLDRNASTYSVATTGVTAEQKGWMSAVDTANNGAATPSFYIIDPVSEKKVPVYLDDTDSTNVVWKVDTTSFGITSDVSINNTNISTIKANLMDAYGINVTTSALETASSVYLNATETDISAFLSLSNGGGVAGVASASTFDFGFYTQVVGKDANNQDVVVNVGLNHNYTAGDNWSLNASDVLVKMDYNTVTADKGAAVGGTGGDFIEAVAQSMALGNAGSDTYQLDASDQAIVHEIGDLMGGLVSDEDSIQFELATDMEQLNFMRGRMAGEADGNSLFISSATSGDAKLFDQYNDFLSFRKTEYLVIDDGATADEVFELVTSNPSTNSWDNEVYVAKNTGESINVLEGGEDHVFLGAGNDTVSIDQTSLAAASANSDGDSVTIRNVDVANDTIKVDGSNLTMTGANIDTVVVAHDGIKYIDLASMEEVNADGSFVAALI